MEETTKKLLADAALAITALREYIQAIPDDVVASLPVMPGIDGDWLSEVHENLRVAINSKGNFMPTDMTAKPEEYAEYERLAAWRARWVALASKREPGRLQSHQERIERRALVCNLKIAKVMHAFDVRVNNTVCPVGQKAVNAASMALLMATH